MQTDDLAAQMVREMEHAIGVYFESFEVCKIKAIARRYMEKAEYACLTKAARALNPNLFPNDTCYETTQETILNLRADRAGKDGR